ncbi:MAG: DUF58 domain-containing protein [Janthinobacterium lividum]
MQTLIPEPVTNIAHPVGRRFGRVLGFGLTPRALLLLAAAALLSVPAFLHPGTPWLMFGVDALLLVTCLADAATLPAPERFSVTRRFVHAPEIGRAVEVELSVQQDGGGVSTLRLIDDLHTSIQHGAAPLHAVSYPNDLVGVQYAAVPSQRGDVLLGGAYVRYRSVLGLAERWSVADLQQTVRVYAAGEQASESASIYLLRARQIEMEKRRLRRIGLGREFETMRDYQPGDEMRNISWTATARHNRLITQQFTTERSQQVWIVIDAGRLSRTAYRMEAVLGNGGHDEAHVVTQLDQAASAAGLLARVVGQSGDKLALLTYGRRVQQQLLPGAGHLHLRRVLDALSQVRSEAAEADHLLAATRLRQLQRRRGLVLWVTEMTESVGRPEIVAAVSSLVRRHLVVLVLLQHPELTALAEGAPADARGMYRSTAAQEMLEQRRATLATLRAQGVLVIETTAAGIAADAISQYLEIKAQGRL